MKKVSSVQRYESEKAIIDALLKISEIIKKTTTTTSHSDKKQSRHEYNYTPIPPPMRTLESYVSGFNQHYSSSSQRPVNCNRAPMVLWNDNNHYRKKSSRKYQSFDSHKRRRMKCDCQSRYYDDEYSASDC